MTTSEGIRICTGCRGRSRSDTPRSGVGIERHLLEGVHSVVVLTTKQFTFVPVRGCGHPTEGNYKASKSSALTEKQAGVASRPAFISQPAQFTAGLMLCAG